MGAEPGARLCETCWEEIDPADPAVVYAVEVFRGRAVAGDDDEGFATFFHRHHFPGPPRWREKEKPGPAG